MEKRPYFPMFFDMRGRKVLIIGAGKIALRRVKSLLPFGADISVLAPEAEPELLELSKTGRLSLIRRGYAGPEDLSGFEIVLAATDDAALNRQVHDDCKARGISVNVSTDQSLCDFFFPAIAKNEDMVVGISSSGSDPAKTAELAAKIRNLL